METEQTIPKWETKLEGCATLPELVDAFSLDELVSLARDKILQKWLNNHFMESQAKMLDDVLYSRDALVLRLCDALAIDVTRLSEYDANMVTAALKRENERIKRERECGKDGVIVTNQAELVVALQNEDVRKVYLYDETFSIPLNRSHITYDGRGNALINIMAQGNSEIVDFDNNEVYFYNLTVVFHFLEPHQVRINHSSQNHNHLIFLHADRFKQDNSIAHHEIAEFLAGRTPFETAEMFADRAKRFHEIIVGKTYLKDTDYDLWHEAFCLNPVWRVEFIESIRRYVNGAKLVFPIPCQKAAELYEKERAQLIYADFGTYYDNAVIERLYLHTDSGQGKIYPIYRLRNVTSWAFGSGSGDAGYGLNLIADYS